MAYATPIQTAVNSGELSPRMVARVDFDRYRNGCARARNIVLLPTGGFTKMPGSRFVNAVKDETKAGRLLPFKFSQGDAYIIEMADGVARFYRRQQRIIAPNIGASITNGTFTSNITGWTDASESGASIGHDAAGGRLELNPDGNVTAIARQQVTTTTTGVEHVLRFRADGDLGSSVLVYVGSSAGATDLFDQTRLGLGWHTIAFTPSASPFHVHFACDNALGEEVRIDDVSLLDNVPLELVTGYAEADLAGLSIRQTADVLYLFHPDIPTRKFERRGTRSWSLVTVPWIDGPYGESNPGLDITTRQLVPNPDFQTGLSPWQDLSNATGNIAWDQAQGVATLNPVGTGGDDSAMEIAVPTGVTGSTEFLLHFQILGNIGASATEATSLQVSTAGSPGSIVPRTAYPPGWHSITFTASDATIFIAFIYNGDDAYAGGLGGCYLYRPNARLLELSAVEGSATCTATGHAPFRSSDVGRLIRLTWPGKEPVWGVITAYTSTSVVTVRLRRKAPYASIPTENWRLGKWSATTGYPATAAFFQSRIVAGRTTLEPQTLEFSQTGDLENFRPDTFLDGVSQTQDDDALSYQIASEEVNGISWMTGRRKLIVGTSGGLFVAESDGAALTATDISVTPHSDAPCAQVAPVPIESAVVFLGEDGRQCFDTGFQLDDDAFVVADLTLLASHVLKSPAQEIVMQRRPFQTVWARRADGRLATLAYNRKQDIIGWAPCIMGGSFGGGHAVVESIAVIPGSDDVNQVFPSDERDEVWLIVKRTINGQTHRYIEFFEGYFEGPAREDYDTEADWEDAVKTAQADAFYVHCGGTYEGAATATITGLDHLEGQAVVALAEGRVFAGLTVASGAITLPDAFTKVQVGLPYTWQFETLKMPYGTQSGSGVTKNKSISALGLALLDAGTFSAGIVTYDREEGRVVHELQEIDFLRDGLAMDEATPLFTGEVVQSLDGSTRRDTRLYLEGSAPLPFICLALVPQMNGGER